MYFSTLNIGMFRKGQGSILGPLCKVSDWAHGAIVMFRKGSFEALVSARSVEGEVS